MVPYRRSTELPLLPFEKRLIHELGVTEEEYRRFADEVRAKPYRRPEEYAHVPDVQNTGAEIIAVISLVVGLLSTAASYLLAPKPQQPKTSDIRQKRLGGQTGQENFAPTFGFDSIQQLAQYGQIVPIVFTRQQENVDDNGVRYISGGVLISPLMVWSRMKSWGTYQISEIVAIAGQGPMQKPSLSSIYLGNSALDSIYDEFFDFYWNGGYEALGAGSRLRMYNLRYGALRIDDGRSSADNAFYAPGVSGPDQAAFCGAFTPTSQARFGVYAGIPNGTPFRPNWKVISTLKEWQERDNDQFKQARTDTKKYVDPYLAEVHPYGENKAGSIGSGMPGTGVNFARRVGIVELNGVGHDLTEVNESNRPPRWINLTTERQVNVGDTIKVKFGKNRQEVKPFSAIGDSEPVEVEDVRTAVESELTRWDSAFAIGATFMIGRTMWQVYDRTQGPYDVKAHKNDGFNVKLRCIEAWSENQRKIGIVAKQAIDVESRLRYSDIEEAFYPILRYEAATIQNTRRTEVTEIGIKSNVWAKFNNLCNFNTIPTPGKLSKDKDPKGFNARNVLLETGYVNKYVHRMSFFALDARPSNTDAVRDLTRNEGWINLGEYLFAVLGSTPKDIYSFIRITHANKSQLEFRFRPVNSAWFAQQSGGTGEVFVLDGGATPYKEWSTDNYMGTFRVGGRGYFARPIDYFTHREMAVKPDQIDPNRDEYIDVTYGSWVPDYSRIDVTPNGFENTETGSYDVPFNTISNIMSLFFGEDPYFDNLPAGTRRTRGGWTSENQPGRSIVMEVTVEAFEQSLPTTPRNRWWRIVEVDVQSFTGNWNNGESFFKNARTKNGVQHRFHYLVSIPSKYEESDQPGTTTRLFERYSGIAEVSHYGDLVTRSCDQGPEHEIVYVNESLSESQIPEYTNCAVTGLKLRSSDNFTQLDQLRCFMANGIEVERLLNNDVGPSNLLSDLVWFMLTDKDTGSGELINAGLVDRDGLVTAGRYLEANQLFFDDAVADAVNIRTWLGEIAPTVLCNLSQKNGRFAMEPALPYDSGYRIDPSRTVEIKGMFTDGNIIEDSLNIEWLDLEQRSMFQAAIIYRWTGLNKLPEQRTIVVRYNEAGSADLPLEEFNLQHITSDDHALKVARYFLALRKYVTHSITFQTMPWGLSLAPGDLIRVSTEMSPYSPANNGIVKPDGTVISVSALADGNYSVYYWERDQQEVNSGTLQISGGIAQNIRNAVFSVVNQNVTEEVYQIEAIDLNEDGIVTIKGSNYPVDSSNRSLLARDVLDLDNRFEVIGAIDD
jgi:hypothetical protein